jgi:hypothetical protein
VFGTGICLFDDKREPPQLRLLDLGSGKTTNFGAVELGPRLPGAVGFDVSPDGQWVLYVRVDASNSDIILLAFS